MNTLQQIREDIRCGRFQASTTGLMPNLVQGNVVIMPKASADEFIQFCQINPKPCPIIGVSQPGDPTIPGLCDDLDIRTDIPEYRVFNNGEYAATVSDINAYWADNFVAIIVGCSFSFEYALESAGFPVRNIQLNTNVSMYDTNIPTQRTDRFHCNTVVSMRPYKEKDIDQVIKITSQFPLAHGSPLHIGDPEKIGIKNINQPDYGDSLPLEKDDIPVFWACGVTTQAAIRHAKLPLVITHAPGKMLITDKEYGELPSLQLVQS